MKRCAKNTIKLTVGLLLAAWICLLPLAARSSVTLVVTNHGNVRSGPGLENDIIASVEVGMELESLDRSGDWYAIRMTGGLQGWVHKILVATMPDTVAVSMDIIVVARYGNLRAGPDTSHEIIDKVRPNQKLLALQRQGDWYQVIYSEEKTAWIHEILLQSQQEPVAIPEEAETIEISKTGNFRSGPGTDHEVLAKVYPGNTIYPLETSGNWVRAQLEDGTEGWLHEILLSNKAETMETPIADTPAPVTEIPEISLMDYINKSDVFRRRGEYGDATHYYLNALHSLEELAEEYIEEACVRFYLNKCRFAFYPSSDIYASTIIDGFIDVAVSVPSKDDCYAHADSCATAWQMGKQLFPQLENMMMMPPEFVSSIKDSITYHPGMFPLAAEAEVNRLIGLHYLYVQQNYQLAADHFRTSHRIYSALIDHGLELPSDQQEHFFRATLEMGIAYSKIQQFSDSFRAFDSAHKIALDAHNAKWLNSYRITLKTLYK